jgi:UDP-glucose 4-epimerase
MDIQIAGEQHGLDWCIIRPHNVYGIKQNIWDKYRNVLGIWMYQYMNDQPMTIYGMVLKQEHLVILMII